MKASASDPTGWRTERLTSLAEVLDVFLQLRGRRWLCRGQPCAYGNLRPGIDRILQGRARREKLDFERRSISFLRQTARFFSGAGEEHAMTDDFVALMVLQHYKFRTRLLDWSGSPYVAAFFATSDEVLAHEDHDGEIWAFDEPKYEEVGRGSMVAVAADQKLAR